MAILRDFFAANEMDAGEATIPRILTNNAVLGAGAGVRLTYWTARKTETVQSVRTITGSTAGVSMTLARVGVYSVAANGNLTLIAATDNDTSLWVAANTAYTKAYASTWVKERGRRYATGIVALGSTAPTFVGATNLGGTAWGDEMALSPRLAAQSGLVSSDLPSSISAPPSASALMQYSVQLPA